jgi:hypothetical protein
MNKLPPRWPGDVPPEPVEFLSSLDVFKGQQPTFRKLPRHRGLASYDYNVKNDQGHARCRAYYLIVHAMADTMYFITATASEPVRKPGAPFTKTHIQAADNAVLSIMEGEQTTLPITPTTQADHWITVRARGGVVVRLPAHWRIQGEPTNSRQTARANTIIDLAGLPQNNAALALQANGTNASITISIIPGDFADQATVASLTAARIVSVDSDFRSDLEAGMRIEGAKLIRYRGTSKEKIGPLWSLVTRYTYKMPGHAPLDIESYRIFLGTKSVGFMLQATVGASSEVTKVFKTIKQSFSLSGSD